MFYYLINIVPELLLKQSKTQALVKVYTGLSGRKIIFEDKLKYIEEQYVLGAHMPSDKISLFLENYHNRRILKKIPLKMLFTADSEDAFKRFSKKKYVKAKILTKNFLSPIAINIYGNKIALLLGSESLEPISILIEDKELANNFKQYFNLLWKIAKK